MVEVSSPGVFPTTFLHFFHSCLTSIQPIVASQLGGIGWPEICQPSLRFDSHFYSWYLFDCVLHDISYDGYRPTLPQSYSSTNGLSFNSWIPLWFEEVDTRRSRQIEPRTLVSPRRLLGRLEGRLPDGTSSGCHQKDIGRGVFLKMFDETSTHDVGHITVYSYVSDTASK